MLRSAQFRFSRLRAALGVLSALVVALPLALPLQATPAQALPAGLPTHFGFGLAAGAGDTWMPQSGIHWDYRYQYLVGGVNTGTGWETWNSNGTFASGYATESDQHGYIPVFPYYELLQSNGSCNSCGENQRDLSNLNNAALMNAYYQNFALLMKRLGPGSYDGVRGFGKTALVDVEADFTGGYAVQAANSSSACFGFCTGQGNNPSLLKASVSSSGQADVASYANTFTGYSQALAHLRDVYAPNVLLGYHLSPWATGVDIGSDTSPNTNASALGQQAGTFLSKLGTHELIFNDPLDRDAGLYQTQLGQNRWWDRNNVTFPNFTRWEQFLHGANLADANKPILLWQVPLGNQYFDTLNNTTGHYQDNRAEYIFSHIHELMGVGVVGAMFGAGDGSSTTYTNARGDGITNPASFCTTAGLSSGQICNNHVSTVSDDDGGYIRMQGQAYYQQPIALSGGTAPTATPTTNPTGTATARPTSTPTATVPRTPTPSPTQVTAQRGFTTSASAAPTTVKRGSSVTLTASVKSNTALSTLVDLEVYDSSGAKVFQQAWDNQAFGAAQTRTFSAAWSVPAGSKTGAYTIMIGVFSPGWGTLYGWNGSAATLTVN